MSLEFKTAPDCEKGTEMTLSEAIEEVKRDFEYEGEYGCNEFEGFPDDLSEAIATVLNAIAKGLFVMAG